MRNHDLPDFAMVILGFMWKNYRCLLVCLWISMFCLMDLHRIDVFISFIRPEIFSLI